MTLTEKIKILCIRCGLTMGELAEKMGQSPQNFSGKLKRESFSNQELHEMAEAVGCTYEQYFVLPNGEKI